MLKIVATSITDSHIHLRMSDNKDATRATQWIDFQIPLKELALPSHGGDIRLDNLEKRFLGSIQQAALRYVRDVTADESKALADRLG